jgi:hypothetical protein
MTSDRSSLDKKRWISKGKKYSFDFLDLEGYCKEKLSIPKDSYSYAFPDNKVTDVKDFLNIMGWSIPQLQHASRPFLQIMTSNNLPQGLCYHGILYRQWGRSLDSDIIQKLMPTILECAVLERDIPGCWCSVLMEKVVDMARKKDAFKENLPIELCNVRVTELL